MSPDDQLYDNQTLLWQGTHPNTNQSYEPNATDFETAGSEHNSAGSPVNFMSNPGFVSTSIDPGPGSPPAFDYSGFLQAPEQDGFSMNTPVLSNRQQSYTASAFGPNPLAIDAQHRFPWVPGGSNFMAAGPRQPITLSRWEVERSSSRGSKNTSQRSSSKGSDAAMSSYSGDIPTMSKPAIKEALWTIIQKLVENKTLQEYFPKYSTDELNTIRGIAEADFNGIVDHPKICKS
jgi:hypothetical protein